jgi:hypothetical protein
MRDRADLDEEDAADGSRGSSSSASRSYLLLFVLCMIPLLSIRWRAAVKSSPPSTSSGGNRVSDSPPAPGRWLPSFAAIGGGKGWNLGSKTKPPVLPSMLNKVIAAVRRPPTRPPLPSSIITSSPPSGLYYKLPLPSSWFVRPSVRKGRNASPAMASIRSSDSNPPPPSLPPAFLPPSFVRPPLAMPKFATRNSREDVVSLTGFLGTEGTNVDVELVVLMTHIQAACKHIAAILASPAELQASLLDSSFDYYADRDAPKRVDIIAAE